MQHTKAPIVFDYGLPPSVRHLCMNWGIGRCAHQSRERLLPGPQWAAIPQGDNTHRAMHCGSTAQCKSPNMWNFQTQTLGFGIHSHQAAYPIPDAVNGLLSSSPLHSADNMPHVYALHRTDRQTLRSCHCPQSLVASVPGPLGPPPSCGQSHATLGSTALRQGGNHYLRRSGRELQ